MPLERHIDDLTAHDGCQVLDVGWGAPSSLQGEPRGAARPCRVRFPGTDEKVFEASRELIEQVASDGYDAGTSVDDAGLVLVTSEALARVGRSA